MLFRATFIFPDVKYIIKFAFYLNLNSLMKDVINIYCDESCHLQNDGIDVMAVGAIWCKSSNIEGISKKIKDIKLKHGLKPTFKKNRSLHKPAFELKWHKVSNSKLKFYEELVDFFFDDDNLHFSVLIVPSKSALDHEKLEQTHDGFYYLTYFKMLKIILNPDYTHKIYLDIKDTRGNEKIVNLKEYLINTHYDYSQQIVKKIQQVRSHEVELIQLADLFVGAIAYIHRGLKTSNAKLQLLEQIKRRSTYSLIKPTLVKERKFNIFIWQPNNTNFYVED